MNDSVSHQEFCDLPLGKLKWPLVSCSIKNVTQQEALTSI